MNILICEIKSVCYNSYTYFGDAIGQQFEKNGHNVTYFKVADEPFENIEKFCNKSFDAIIDFNSDLPRALMDDDSYFLDHINAPFFDVILDHPLYHHDSLKHKLRDFHVVCLDNYHKEYIKKYYPHIKSVDVISLTGEKSSVFEENFDEFELRPYDVVFTGSYTDPGKIELAISKIPGFLQKNVMDIIDILLDNPSRTIESAVNELSENAFYDYIKTDVALHTQSFYLADAYVRCINRENVIKALDTPEINLHVFGGCWEELNLHYATIHKEVPFSLSFVSLGHSKISLNVMPNFKNGAHDRIFSSQLNGAAVLTDPSESLMKEYKNNQNILFYDLKHIDDIKNQVITALSDTNQLKKIAQNGQTIASQNHTWAKIYEVFKKIITN